MLPICCLANYEVLDYTDKPFEQSLRHITEYNDLLCSIETLSKQLNERIESLKQTCPNRILDEYRQLLQDREDMNERYWDSEEDLDELIANQDDRINEYETRIKNELDRELYEEAGRINQEIYFLLDDKYNEHDKYYMD